MSVYHDLVCPRCGTTNLDVSDVRVSREAAGQVYGFTDRNVLRALGGGYEAPVFNLELVSGHSVRLVVYNGDVVMTSKSHAGQFVKVTLTPGEAFELRHNLEKAVRLRQGAP